jgi:tetratricopeptide (TPR) repeat protein
MQKLIELLSHFVPVLAGFPKWVQFGFFAVVLQTLLLSFTMFYYYISGQIDKAAPKRNATQPTTSARQPFRPKPDRMGKIPAGTSVAILQPEKNPEMSLVPSVPKIPKSSRNISSESRDPGVAVSLANLAALYEGQGKYRDAEVTWVRVISIRERAYGREHPEVASSLQALANLYVQTGRLQEAKALQAEAVVTVERAYGPEHPVTATALNGLAVIMLKLADFSAAAPLIERALSIRSKALGPDHPDMIPLMRNLASIYLKAGRKEDANRLTERIASLQRNKSQQ